MSPTPLVQCKTVDLQVPAETEFVLEGHITHQLTDEGPFLDLTETMDFVRQQPVIEITCITHRRDAIYQALLPGKLEHKLLMGMPKEPTIFAAVNEVCECRDVLITPGGTSWLHAVVSIVKRGPEDGRRAIEAAFKGHGSLKHVVVVDDDINIHDSRRSRVGDCHALAGRPRPRRAVRSARLVARSIQHPRARSKDQDGQDGTRRDDSVGRASRGLRESALRTDRHQRIPVAD